MARRIFLKETQSNSPVPAGFVSLSNQGGELKTGDSTGIKPISSTGEKFIAKGDVYEGELVYLNTDGTVSVPGNVEGDDNKADNIIGIFLSDADDSETVSVITKGIISLDSFDFIPRTIYYITTDGKLTTSITPYIFGKSLSSNNIMIDISFVQSILNRFGVEPTFDKLVVSTTNDNVLNLNWSSQDEIYSFEVPEYRDKFDYSSSPLASTASIILSQLVTKHEIESGSYLLGRITNADEKSAEFKFQIIKGNEGGTESKVVQKYFGLGSKYSDGVGIFDDIPYFSGVNVEFILLSDSKWLFGSRNILPLRKLFGNEFVKKDDKGLYVLVNFSGELIRLYESGTWSVNVSSRISSFKISLFTGKPFVSGETLNIYKGDFKSQPDSSELIFQLVASKLGSKESPYVAFVEDLKTPISASDVFSMTLDTGKEESILSTLKTPTVVEEKGTQYLLFDLTEVVNNNIVVDVEAEYNGPSTNYDPSTGEGLFIDKISKDSDLITHVILYSDYTFEFGDDDQGSGFFTSDRSVNISGVEYTLFTDSTWDYYVAPPSIESDYETFYFNSSVQQVLDENQQLVENTVGDSLYAGDRFGIPENLIEFTISGFRLNSSDTVTISVSDDMRIEIRNMGVANNPTEWDSQTTVSSDWLVNYTDLDGGLVFQVRMIEGWTVSSLDVEDNGDGTYTYYGAVNIDSSEVSLEIPLEVGITIKQIR